MLGATDSCSDSHCQSVSNVWCLSLCFKEAVAKTEMREGEERTQNFITQGLRF